MYEPLHCPADQVGLFTAYAQSQASKYITTHDLVRVLRFLNRPTKLDGQTYAEMDCASPPLERERDNNGSRKSYNSLLRLEIIAKKKTKKKKEE